MASVPVLLSRQEQPSECTSSVETAGLRRGSQEEEDAVLHGAEHAEEALAQHKGEEKVGGHGKGEACGRKGGVGVGVGGVGGGGIEANCCLSDLKPGVQAPGLCHLRPAVGVCRRHKFRTRGPPAERVSRVWISEGTSQPKGPQDHANPAATRRRAGAAAAEDRHTRDLVHGREPLKW